MREHWRVSALFSTDHRGIVAVGEDLQPGPLGHLGGRAGVVGVPVGQHDRVSESRSRHQSRRAAAFAITDPAGISRQLGLDPLPGPVDLGLSP
jgi:hypothetical protein